MSRKRDEQLGASGEADFFTLLRDTFSHAKKQAYHYPRFDFFDPETSTDFELKTRRCAITAHPDIFISASKVRAGRHRRSTGTASRTIFVWSFETPGWAGREYWAWVDDGRPLEMTRNGNRSRGDYDTELMLVPRSLLLPWSMFVLAVAPTSLPSLETITEGLESPRKGTYCPSHAGLPSAPTGNAS
jgi:hypothetical protein